MCEDCGCGTINHTHEHDGHVHSHGPDHDHAHDHSHEHGREISLEKKILSRNDEQAEKNRSWLTEHKVVAMNIISSPGSGKTLLLEKTLEMLQGQIKCAVITGDQQTDNDANRLEGKGANIRHIETISACHLNAETVGKLLPEVVDADTKLLFIENVGNLVCPSAFDLGENFKIALLSTTEGEDKPVKYPSLFSQAPITVLTKMDLVPHLDWDIKLCREYLRQINPGVFIFEVSSQTGNGLDAWKDYLINLTID